MMKHGSHRKVTVGAVLVGALVCLPTIMVALAAEPSQDADQEQQAGKRVLFRDGATDEGQRRIVIRHPDGKNAGRMLLYDPDGDGDKRKVILRDSEDGEPERMLIRDPDADGDGRRILFDEETGKVLVYDPEAEGDGRKLIMDEETGRMLIRDPERQRAGRKIIIRVPDVEGNWFDWFWLFRGPESDGDEPATIRRATSHE